MYAVLLSTHAKFRRAMIDGGITNAAKRGRGQKILPSLKKPAGYFALLLFCTLHVVAQEPPDSTAIKHATIELADSIAAQPPTNFIPNDAETLNEISPETPADTVQSNIIHLSDTTNIVEMFPIESPDIYAKHSPAKAAMMSAVLPGLGQIYNRKYWKVPIVYAAVGISAGIFLRWQNEYERMRRAYIDLLDNDPYTNYFDTLGFPDSYSTELKVQYVTKRKDVLRTWRDWSIVAVVATYALNIIDANVDAHLMDFSLDDNISLNIRPCFLENSIYSKKIGLTLHFSF